MTGYPAIFNPFLFIRISDLPMHSLEMFELYLF